MRGRAEGPSRRAARPAEEEIQETDTANQRRQANLRQTEGQRKRRQ